MALLRSLKTIAAVSMLSLAFAGPALAGDDDDDDRKPRVHSAGNKHRVNQDKREGALDSYVNPDTDDPAAQMKLLLQQVYSAEQRAVENQFVLNFGDRVRFENIFYRSGDLLVPGHVFSPKNPIPGKRYPAVVLVHGGFHETLDYWQFPMIAELVDRGYVVIFPEYRGSRGFGADYYDNDYGVTDTADVLAAANYIATRPTVDPDRLAIVGESRGGMVTLLAIEQAPKRFKAAVDIVGLTDFVAYMAYKPEYRRREVARTSPSFGGELPDKNLPAYMAVSPINAVDKIETPLLIMASTGDKIAPLTLHTGRLLDALKARGKVYAAKIYDNAPGGHVMMHGDTPERRDAMNRLLAWLERYLGSAAK